jgi:hypothetical protein
MKKKIYYIVNFINLIIILNEFIILWNKINIYCISVYTYDIFVIFLTVFII